MELNKSFYKTCFVAASKWNYLANLAMEEDWENKETPSKNQHPILISYISHTYERLVELHKDNSDGNWIYKTDSFICMHTGLLTKNYEWIYMIMTPNAKANKTPYELKGFYKESEQEVCIIENLPKKATYINKIEDLIFDTSAKIVPNFEHILEDEENRNRIPESIRNSPNLLSTLNGEIQKAIKRVACNYKIAVPQYYDGKIQFLLPLSLSNDSHKTDLVLAVDKLSSKCYKGYTCLTLDMAYNNARLISKPETEWLVRT